MRKLRSTMMCLLIFSAYALAQAPKDKPKHDEKQFLGKWKLVSSSTPLPPGMTVTVDFLKENKVELTLKLDDKKSVLKGTWKLENNMLFTEIESEEGIRKDKSEIKKLTDTDLELEDEKKMTEKYTKIKE